MRSPDGPYPCTALGETPASSFLVGGTFVLICSVCRRPVATADDGRCGDCASSQTSSGARSAASSLLRPVRASLRSPVGLGRAVMILLGVVVLTDIAAIAATVNTRALLSPMRERPFAFPSEAEGERADWFVYITTSLQMMAFLAAGVVFIIWFHRVRKNADVFAPGLFKRGSGWAIGSWFIPLAFLWLPRGIAVQVWTASRPRPYAGDEHEPSTPVNLWWGAFLATWLVTRLVNWRYEAAETPQEIVSATELLVAAGIVDIVAALLAIRFVHKLTGMQRARVTERTRPAPDPHHLAPADAGGIAPTAG